MPYRGNRPVQPTDLLAGLPTPPAWRAGGDAVHPRPAKLRCIATGTTQRLAQLPEVPTVAEQGFPASRMTQWYGVLALSNLPQAAVDKLAAARASSVKQPGLHRGARTSSAAIVAGSIAGRVRALHRYT